MAPERITVTVDRYGEPIVFGADLTERARANECTVVDYVRADLAENEADRDLLRKARGYVALYYATHEPNDPAAVIRLLADIDNAIVGGR